MHKQTPVKQTSRNFNNNLFNFSVDMDGLDKQLGVTSNVINHGGVMAVQSLDGLLWKDKREPIGASLGVSDVQWTNGFSKSGIYTCGLCEGWFYTKLELTAHHRAMHMLECFECGMKFHSQQHLFAHEQAMHATQSLTCQYCAKTCKTKHRLREHIKTHTKPHKCTYCAKSFSTRGGLRTHVDAVHLKIKRHKCDQCGRSFSDHRTLKRHKAIHERAASGKTEHQCVTCNKYFSRKSTLKRHLKNGSCKGVSR